MSGNFTDGVTDTIRGEMKRRKISQAALARQLGVTQQTVSRRLNGEVPFDTKEIETIAGILGLRVQLRIESIAA